MNFIVNLLILLPSRIASHFSWAGPLIMRLIVGYTFMLTGWGKLTNLAQVTENFIGWGIPFPKILTPFVSGVECFGGAMLTADGSGDIAPSGGTLAVRNRWLGRTSSGN